jgi:hypothetical protein
VTAEFGAGRQVDLQLRESTPDRIPNRQARLLGSDRLLGSMDGFVCRRLDFLNSAAPLQVRRDGPAG